MKRSVHVRSATDLWEMPPVLFQQLHAEFGFTLDVCATAENAKCGCYFTPANDGLAQAWRGVCWMNPPYSAVIGRWVQKAYESAQAGLAQDPQLADSDRAFIKMAASSGLAEIQLRKLAAERADNSEMRDFAKRLEKDHTQGALELLKSWMPSALAAPGTWGRTRWRQLN